jgi:hypothetical protein
MIIIADTMAPPWKPPPAEDVPWNITNSPKVNTNGARIRTVVMMTLLSTYGRRSPLM